MNDNIPELNFISAIETIKKAMNYDGGSPTDEEELAMVRKMVSHSLSGKLPMRHKEGQLITDKKERADFLRLSSIHTPFTLSSGKTYILTEEDLV